MPRVLSILNRPNIGGPIIVASLQAKFLSPEFETLLICGHLEENEKNGAKEFERFGITPYYLAEMGRELNLKNDIIAYRKLKNIIQEFKPDIVHTHSAKPGALGRLAAFAMKVPVIVHTFHGHVFHSYFSPLKTNFYIQAERWLAKRSTKIIAISPLQKKELSEVYKIAQPNQIEMIPVGLFLDPFFSAQDKKRSKFRKEFNLDDNIIVITISGRVVPIKNHSLFIKSLNYLKSSTNFPFKAFIVGDGICRSAIEQQCREYGLSYCTPGQQDYTKEVIFTGWRDDMDLINAGSDIIALTSLNEGTPLSLIEAQASGKPVIATDVGGVADAVCRNETALLSDLKDEYSFFSNMALLVNDKEMRNDLGTKGPSWVLEKYGHTRLVTDIGNLYLRLLAEAKQD